MIFKSEFLKCLNLSFDNFSIWAFTILNKNLCDFQIGIFAIFKSELKRKLMCPMYKLKYVVSWKPHFINNKYLIKNKNNQFIIENNDYNENN